MNVLFISSNSPLDSIGGVERYISNLIEYSKSIPDTNIGLMLPTFDQKHQEQHGNLTLYYEPSMSITRHASGMQKEIAQKAQLFADSVQSIIDTAHIQIICAENFHIGLPPAFSLLLNMKASQNNIPLVLHLHSFSGSPLQSELVNQLPWRRVSCVSKSVAGDCFHKGADIDSLSTEYLGVDTHKFKNAAEMKGNLKQSLGLPDEAKILLCASRIVAGPRNIIKEKGLINVIQAFSKISPRYENLHLVLATGTPPKDLLPQFQNAKTMLEGYIKLNNIETKTIVKTFPLDTMPEVYNGSDIFVLASENETFGQVFIESMACGLPVIGTKVGGIPEIISDSYNGYLITPDDSSILAQRIEKLLNDTDTRNRFIEAGLKTVETNFTSQKQFHTFFATLEDIIS